MSQFRVRTDLAVEARDYVMDQKEELRGIRVEEVKDEDYQEIKGVKYHMDERELIQDILAEM